MASERIGAHEEVDLGAGVPRPGARREPPVREPDPHRGDLERLTKDGARAARHDDAAAERHGAVGHQRVGAARARVVQGLGDVVVIGGPDLQRERAVGAERREPALKGNRLAGGGGHLDRRARDGARPEVEHDDLERRGPQVAPGRLPAAAAVREVAADRLALAAVGADAGPGPRQVPAGRGATADRGALLALIDVLAGEAVAAPALVAGALACDAAGVRVAGLGAGPASGVGGDRVRDGVGAVGVLADHGVGGRGAGVRHGRRVRHGVAGDLGPVVPPTPEAEAEQGHRNVPDDRRVISHDETVRRRRRDVKGRCALRGSLRIRSGTGNCAAHNDRPATPRTVPAGRG